MQTNLPHTDGANRRTCRLCRASYEKERRKKPEAVAYQKHRNRIFKLTNAYYAKMEVYKAVRTNKIPSPKTLICVDCGNDASEYDHRDYNKPLEVSPVCRSCNAFRGRGKNYNGN